MVDIINNEELIASLEQDTCPKITISAFNLEALERLKPLIANSKNLHTIVFADYDFFRTYHGILADALKSSMVTKLEIPNERYIKFLKAALENPAEKLEVKFTEIYLSNFKDFNVAELSNLHKISKLSISGSDSDEEMPLAIVQLITNSPNLQKLSLSGFALNDQNAKLITDFLSQAQLCSSLKFNSCKISQHSQKDLFQAIRENHTIKKTDIKFCDITHEAIEYSFTALAWSYLKKLTIDTRTLEDANHARLIAPEVRRQREFMLNAWNKFCLINKHGKTKEGKIQALPEGPIRKIAEYADIGARPQLEIEVSATDEIPSYIRNLGLYSDIM